VDPGTPAAGDLTTQAVIDAMRVIDSPLIVGFQPFVTAAGVTIIPAPGAAAAALNANGRNNCFVVWDGKPLALATGGDYKADIIALAGQLGAADSYTALYGPWITVPDPSRAGATITVPPSGSVIGMIARVDATVGPWRAPAGTPAVLSTAVAPELRFTETDQGTLNSQNINDRYVSDRRTLIYIEESIKRSTQWAVFENNDQRLWSSLRNAVINLLQPVWESGGLAGNSASDAYFVHCDDTLNNPQVIQSGEVRMEVGLALQFPAEFVVIRVSQFDSGSSIVSEAITI
jgi:phage tail sheath protein FI